LWNRFFFFEKFFSSTCLALSLFLSTSFTFLSFKFSTIAIYALFFTFFNISYDHILSVLCIFYISSHFGLCVVYMYACEFFLFADIFSPLRIRNESEFTSLGTLFKYFYVLADVPIRLPCVLRITLFSCEQKLRKEVLDLPLEIRLFSKKGLVHYSYLHWFLNSSLCAIFNLFFATTFDLEADLHVGFFKLCRLFYLKNGPIKKFPSTSCQKSLPNYAVFLFESQKLLWIWPFHWIKSRSIHY